MGILLAGPLAGAMLAGGCAGDALGREGLETGQRVDVEVRFTDGSRAVLVEHAETVTLRRVQPNGPDCPPVCAVASVAVGAG